MWLIALFGLLAAALALGSWLRRRRLDTRQLYRRQLEAALSDGILTAEEAAELQSFREKKDVTEIEARMVALAIYRRALRDAAADARFTPEEQQHLANLQKQLDLTADDLSADREQMHRLWLFSQVERGRLPEVRPPVSLGAEERCHWVVRGSFCQRTGLPAAQRGEPANIVFRIADDAPFELSGPRDALAAEDRILPVDVGSVLLTDRRLVFRGARRRFHLPYVSLESVAVYRDGLRLIGSEGATTFLLVEDAELTAAILVQAARGRRGEVTGMPIRSASEGRAG